MEQKLIDDADIVQETADYICKQLENAAKCGVSRIVLGLSGGNSPKALYAYLAQLLSSDIASKLVIIQIDERVVEARHQDSNQNMIREHASLLLEKGATFHPIVLSDASDTLENRQQIVREYNAMLVELFAKSQYTLAILGAGEDGHTASIFPSAILEEQDSAHGKDMVFSTIHKHLGYYRISLSYRAIFSFQTALFYIPGLAKQSIVKRIINTKKQSEYPASYVLHKHKNSILVASEIPNTKSNDSIPHVTTEDEKNAFAKVTDVLRYLRGPSGCPWDRKQTLESIRTHMLEESAELVDAIHRYENAKTYDTKQEILEDAKNHIREEFGDVLLVWIMMMIIYQEEEKGSMQTTLQELAEKLIRRHPHVFSINSDSKKNEKDDTELAKQWNAIKVHQEGKTHTNISFQDFHPVLDILERTKKFQNQHAKATNIKQNDGREIPRIIAAIHTMLSSLSTDIPTKISKSEQDIAEILYAVVELSRAYKVSPTAALMRYNTINSV